MKVVVDSKETPINEFAIMLKNGEYWAKVPWTFDTITSGAILIFGKDNNGFYRLNVKKEKIYIDLLKIPSVHLVKIVEEEI